jgi:hypothetical protein
MQILIWIAICHFLIIFSSLFSIQYSTSVSWLKINSLMNVNVEKWWQKTHSEWLQKGLKNTHKQAR